ncbi:MAG: hypothetical protein AABX63_05215 [Nanoarchaeota archaeon]
MLNKKDAQGFSINIIVLAVISLIILVVLIAILTGRIGNFIGTVKESQSCNQICQIKDYSGGVPEPRPGYEILIGARDSNGKQCYCRKP